MFVVFFLQYFLQIFDGQSPLYGFECRSMYLKRLSCSVQAHQTVLQNMPIYFRGQRPVPIRLNLGWN